MVAKRATSGGTYAEIYQIDLRASELKRRVKCGDIEGQVVLDALEALLKPLRNPRALETVELTQETTLESIHLYGKAANITSQHLTAIGYIMRGSWVETLGELAYTSEAYLRSIRNVGPGIIASLRQVLDQAGIEIGSRMEHPEDPDVILHEVYGSLPFKRLLETKLDSDLIYGYDQKSDVRELMLRGIRTFGELIPLTEDEILSVLLKGTLAFEIPEDVEPKRRERILALRADEAKNLYSVLHDPMPGLYEKLEDQVH